MKHFGKKLESVCHRYMCKTLSMSITPEIRHLPNIESRRRRRDESRRKRRDTLLFILYGNGNRVLSCAVSIETPVQTGWYPSVYLRSHTPLIYETRVGLTDSETANIAGLHKNETLRTDLISNSSRRTCMSISGRQLGIRLCTSDYVPMRKMNSVVMQRYTSLKHSTCKICSMYAEFLETSIDNLYYKEGYR